MFYNKTMNLTLEEASASHLVSSADNSVEVSDCNSEYGCWESSNLFPFRFVHADSSEKTVAIERTNSGLDKA